MESTSIAADIRLDGHADDASEARYAIAIHGGAGIILRENMTAELEAETRAALSRALTAGRSALSGGEDAMTAVIRAITILEDSPLFNAGKGAVYNAVGSHELDASVMDGRTLNAGAVAGISRIESPIALAKAVMDRSPHVMLQGTGAEAFAASQGFELVDPSLFDTDLRWQQLQRARALSSAGVAPPPAFKMGTVGAVALDKEGNLAAGTSTGGMTNKRFGRVGDSPILGAGTYASNQSCAVSATGHGEFFIRRTVARDICARMEFAGSSLSAAAKTVVMQQLTDLGGSGGVVAVDREGNISMTFNSEGMYRGAADWQGRFDIAIFGDEGR